jgi:hypothetical protein
VAAAAIGAGRFTSALVVGVAPDRGVAVLFTRMG